MTIIQYFPSLRDYTYNRSISINKKNKYSGPFY